MVAPRTLWECYGPVDCSVLAKDGQALLRNLKARPELNGSVVNVKRWDGQAGRFEVQLDGSDEGLKVRPSNLEAPRPPLAAADWAAGESHFGDMPADVGLAVAHFLRVRCAAQLASASRAVRITLWLQQDAKDLWHGLLVRRFGKRATEAILRARPGVEGPAMYRTARALRLVFKAYVEIVPGSVAEQADGMEVVACPVMRSLLNVGVGAQGAVRRAAGAALEAAVQRLETPVGQLSVTLVPGGALAEKVALTVTEPPDDLMNSMQEGSLRDQVLSVVAYITRLHANLFRTVREGGFRSLALPTLATGGMGIPPPLVAVAAFRALHQDYCLHPDDPLRVRVACFDREEIQTFYTVKEEAFRHLFAPEQAERIVMSLLAPTLDSDDSDVPSQHGS